MITLSRRVVFCNGFAYKWFDCCPSFLVPVSWAWIISKPSCCKWDYTINTSSINIDATDIQAHKITACHCAFVLKKPFPLRNQNNYSTNFSWIVKHLQQFKIVVCVNTTHLKALFNWRSNFICNRWIVNGPCSCHSIYWSISMKLSHVDTSVK